MQLRDVQKLSIPKNNVGGILGSFARKQQKSNVNMKGVTEKFKNEVHMHTHYKIHTEEGKEWQCQICDKQCASLQSFKQHMKRHPKA